MYLNAAIAPAVERVIGNDEVTGSNPVGGTIFLLLKNNHFINILQIIIYSKLYICIYGVSQC